MLEDLLQRRPYNAVTDLIDAQVERGLAGKAAFTDADRTLTYGDLQARSCRFASALLDIGLRPEERLALLLCDTVDFSVAFWGGVRAGIVALPLNTLLNAEQYAYILADSRTSAIVASASLAKTLLPILDRVPRLRSIMAFPLSVGATSILLPQRPTPEAVFEVMRRHRPTIFYGVPTLYASLLAHKDMAPGAGSDRLRLCISAGEPLPRALGERWRQASGVDVLDGIGSTEMFQTFLSNSPGDVRYGTTGKPVPGYDLKILDEQGREVADDEIGELIVRGATAAEGYWNQRAKSRRTFAGEWTCTGDKYYRDGEGYYHYCGRTDDMFKVSGMWVSPFEVEAALASHEAVLEAAVIGKQDADGLIKPKAFIVLRNGFAADERLLENLRVHVKNCAGPWKYPRWIDIRPDLPRTATGKIQRFKLRELEG